MISQMMGSFVLIILIVASIITESKFYDIDDVEIDRLLQKLNKPALKSIQSPDGDIIDCVHMKNHPIYDHSLFKNYTIQMRPSSYREGWNNKTLDIKKENIVTQLWTINGKCPKNSIPIRRTKREDILREKSIKKFRKNNSNNFPQPNLANLTKNNGIHEYAVFMVNGSFKGAQAMLNVWKPFVQTPGEFSSAQMWLMAGPIHEMNVIQFGWQVYPEKYGDDNPRYFIQWTADGFRTICYNLECERGFIPVNREFVLGGAINQVSTVDGQQYDISATIWKDSRSGNWWLKVNHHIFVGYWPSELFNHLQNGANAIHWGGEIVNYRDGLQHTTTQMGSGHFAREGYKKASYFRNLLIYDGYGNWIKPNRGHTYTPEPRCYNARSNNNRVWGTYFYYGGPGRNHLCT